MVEAHHDLADVAGVVQVMELLVVAARRFGGAGTPIARRLGHGALRGQRGSGATTQLGRVWPGGQVRPWPGGRARLDDAGGFLGWRGSWRQRGQRGHLHRGQR